MSEPTDPSSGPDSPDTTSEDPPSGDSPSDEEQRTRIIRRAPSEPIPVVGRAAEARTTHVAPPLQDATRAAQVASTEERGDRTAVAACTFSIIGGWATAPIARDLITGWWSLNRVFCIAVAFLTLVFAISSVSGVVALLQRRPIGRWLIVIGAVVALLTYGGLFIAGARFPWIVYILPVLPLASGALALHPQTRRWLTE